MTLFLASAAIMLVATLALCVGTLLGRRPLSGSCGGLSCGRDELGQQRLCTLCRRGSPHDTPGRETPA